MASVPNVGIKTFIGGLQKDNLAWIGGSRPEGSDPYVGWEWLDNSAWSYANWQDGEPNGRTELCLVQYETASDNRWNDNNCETFDFAGYVCEKQ